MTREFDDESLRSAYTATMDESSMEHRPDCPSVDAIQAALAGKGGGPEAERLATLDRAMACPACRREIALLHALAAGEARENAAKLRRSPWTRLVPMAAAASIILVVGIVSVHKWGTDGTLPDELVRDGGGMALVTPANGASVAAGNVTFAWRRVPSALRYTLEVDASDGTVLFTTQTIDTTVTAALAKTPPGEHRWLVRTSTDFGTEIRSETRVLRLH
jgi:hypothetical protein